MGAAARALHAHVILVAKDASDHTWRRAKSFAAGTDQQCIRLDCSKDEMGQAIGRTSLAIAAITDIGLALALAESANVNPDSLSVLSQKAQHAKKRQAEAKAHLRNKRIRKKSKM